MMRHEYEEILTGLPEWWLEAVLGTFAGDSPLLPDLAQDVRMRALRVDSDSMARFQTVADVRKFVCGIARHVGIDALNEEKKRAARFVAGNWDIDDRPHQQPDLETKAIEDQELALLIAAIEALPRKMRRAVAPYLLDDLTAKEVAVRLKITEKSVRARLQAAARYCSAPSRASLFSRLRRILWNTKKGDRNE